MSRRLRLPGRAFVMRGAAAFALTACGGGEGSTVVPTPQSDVASICSEAQALSAASLAGASLGAKQVALTFDDGPSSRTLELSSYLKSEGIRAAFFVNGHCFGQGNPCGNPNLSAAQVLTQVVADGHIIANHTENHLDLTGGSFPEGANGDSAIAAELASTDEIIAPYVPFNRFLFRPPYGAWNARDYDVLRVSAMNKYIGPVRWDVGGAMSGNDANGYGADWDCWQNRSGFGVKTTAQCAARYLNEIHAVDRGITLMHDSDNGNMPNHDANVGEGNTIDMVKVLIPLLKAQGYTFVRLDEVPAIDAALSPVPPPPPPPPPPQPPASDAGAVATPTPNASPPPASSDSSGTAPTATTSAPPEASTPAPDPCAAKTSSPREYPHSASVH